jgi:hypothetical protein
MREHNNGEIVAMLATVEGDDILLLKVLPIHIWEDHYMI